MKIKRGLGSALVGLSALASTTFADLSFLTNSVWSVPRIYDYAEKEVDDYFAIEPGKLYFKAAVKEMDGQVSGDSLIMRISGPENREFNWGYITLNPGATSYRQKLEEPLAKGNYNVSFELGNGQIISRDFAVVPEPSTGALLLGGGALGGAVLYRKNKRKSFEETVS